MELTEGEGITWCSRWGGKPICGESCVPKRLRRQTNQVPAKAQKQSPEKAELLVEKPATQELELEFGDFRASVSLNTQDSEFLQIDVTGRHTGEPLPGAVVRLDGQVYRLDETGRLRLGSDF